MSEAFFDEFISLYRSKFLGAQCHKMSIDGNPCILSFRVVDNSNLRVECTVKKEEVRRTALSRHLCSRETSLQEGQFWVADIGPKKLETHLNDVGLEMEVGAYFEVFEAAVAKDMEVTSPNTTSLSLDLTYRLSGSHSDIGSFSFQSEMEHVPLSMIEMIFALPFAVVKRWRTNGGRSLPSSSSSSSASASSSVELSQSKSPFLQNSPQKRKGPMSLGNPNRRQQKKKRGGGAVLKKAT
jgi:hypothetical protein